MNANDIQANPPGSTQYTEEERQAVKERIKKDSGNNEIVEEIMDKAIPEEDRSEDKQPSAEMPKDPVYEGIRQKIASGPLKENPAATTPAAEEKGIRKMTVLLKRGFSWLKKFKETRPFLFSIFLILAALVIGLWIGGLLATDPEPIIM